MVRLVFVVVTAALALAAVMAAADNVVDVDELDQLDDDTCRN